MNRATGHDARDDRRKLAAVTVAALLMVVVAGCDSNDDAAATTDGAAEPVRMRLGYFPNVTHATAIVGVERGILAENLGADVTLETATFNSGADAIEALFSGAIDATFIGPSPTINGYAQSKGEALRIVAGATSGGAFLVVKPDIESAEDLRGKTLSTPDLGNTQDVALRAWLADEGLETDLEGGGDVSIIPQDNDQIFQTFRNGDIDGAWVPEPWATLMVTEADGEVLVDERDLWPEGQFVTTHLIVTTGFLEEHPDVVQRLLEGHVESIDYTVEKAVEAQQSVVDAIEELTGARVEEETIARSWESLEFTVDPIADSLRESAEDAEEVGLLEPVDLVGIYDLSLLNDILLELGLPEVDA